MSDQPKGDYHLDYDTNDMSPEEYAQLLVKPAKAPVTGFYNISRLIGATTGQTKLERWAKIEEYMARIPETEVHSLMHKWEFWARDNQVAPGGHWTYWLLLAGRGFGKTRTGAEWVNKRVELGLSKRIALVAPTAADVRKVMVEGESGIMAKAPPWNRPHFEPSKLQLTWPNGAIAQMFSAEEPERLRGPQCDTFWADELCAWKNMQETWDMLMFGFRLGRNPQGCITTTPKPVPLLKEIMAGEKDGSAKVVRGSTYDNRGNLAKPFFDKVVKKYEGTRLGRQELNADILEDMPGALWSRPNIDQTRIQCNTPPITKFVGTDEVTGMLELLEPWESLKGRAHDIMKAIPEDLGRIIVAVDPNASNNEGSDEIGITVQGKGVTSGRGYVLADLSMKGSPNEWASTAVLAHDLFNADRVIGEANQGGNMVEHTIASAAKFLKIQGIRKSDFVGVTLVHATRGKVTRAEPVSALYEQGRVSHVGTMRVLEDQMCLFTADFDRKSMGYSPDRVDALVWGMTHLFLENNTTGILEFYQQEVVARDQALLFKTDESAYIKLKAPVGVSQAYGMDGCQYMVDETGHIAVPVSEVRGFRNGGFVEA